MAKDLEGLKIKLNADTGPLELFIKILEALSKLPERPFVFGDLLSELVRIESNPGPANANEISVTFYPSDALLRYASALGTRDFDFHIIEKTAHGSPPV